MLKITLTSDYGNASLDLARLKAKITSTFENVVTVDLFHDVKSWDIAQEIFIFNQLRSAIEGEAIHLLTVNQNAFRHIAAFANGQWFLAPDNGVLPEILKFEKAKFFYLGDSKNPNFPEFLYLPVIQKLIHNNFDYPEFSPRKAMFASSPHPVKNALVAYYLAADKFGNCIVNLTKKEFYEFTQNRNFEIMVNYTDSVYRISENFMEEQSATLIAYFNAADYLVIAYTMGHAERLFGLNKTEKIFINIK